MKTICLMCNRLIIADRKRKYCSYACYWESKKKKVDRVCLFCQNKFISKPSLVKLGCAKFCSESCRRAYKKEHKLTRREIWSKYNASRKGKLKKRQWHENRWFDGNISLIGAYAPPCESCGSVEAIIVHHRDGNNGRNGKPMNNNKSNLAVLCRRCHPIFHNRWGIKEVVSNV